MNVVKGVLWDYGGTLECHDDVDWRPICAHVLDKVYDSLLAANIGPRDLSREAFREQVLQDWFGWWGQPDCNGREVPVARLVLRAAGHEDPMPDMLRVAQDNVDQAVPRDPVAAPFPDALESLRRLRKAGIVQGVLTNNWMSERCVRDFLEPTGLLACMKCVISSANHGMMKPHPSVFHHALERLDMPAAQVVFIGDSLEADVAGAQGVGMRAIWLRNGKDRDAEGFAPDDVCDTRAQAVDTVLRWAETT